jgi:aspartate carbamoyltransferase catalytic subunit
MLLHPNLLSEEYRDFFYDTPHNAYFAQTRAAVFVRMALLEGVSRDEGTEHRL